MFFLTIAAGIAWYVSELVTAVPDYELLNQFEPRAMTRVYAADGEVIAEYARERRIYLPIEVIPERLRAAFISAEDRNFYSHRGIDFIGILRAVVQNAQSYGSDQRLVGGSTITQQVAKNFLLSREQTWDRKIQEAILAVRIENALSKDEILELYMNEVNLGLGAYGVAAGAIAYFGKSVQELDLAECAYLAALLKGPSNYHPVRYPERAIERRNLIIDQMVENGYATTEEGETARAKPLVVPDAIGAGRFFDADSFSDSVRTYLASSYGEQTLREGIPTTAASYFSEEVRRELIGLYGEERVYSDGMTVRTSLEPELQILARKTLMDGLLRYDMARGWRGPEARIEDGDDWAALSGARNIQDVFEWRIAVVRSVDGAGATIELRPTRDSAGQIIPEPMAGTIPLAEMRWAGSRANQILRVGDVIFVERVSEAGRTFRLRQIPEINGAMVAMRPDSGRVVAMVGGFSFAQSQFNRATQAYRQPGSAFKPFVYATAIENGYTPASIMDDEPISIPQGPGLPLWRPQNYSGDFYGPLTLRMGLELSRNVMTVRLAQQVGMPLIADYAERFGIYDRLAHYLPMAIGSGETTVLRLVAGYAVIANQGRQVRPTLIDLVQDRSGTILRSSETRVCAECNAERWTGQAEPAIADYREAVIDPLTAYQITSIMEGVVQRGTATVVQGVGHPIAGKTGTTNDFRDAWFIGFSPDLVVGVYLGFDNPHPLGSGNTGGVIAAPIFTEFMRVALADEPPKPFRVPYGISLIPIDRRSGVPTEGTGAGVILEAFKDIVIPEDQPLPTAAVADPSNVVARATQYVNLRSGPSRDSSVITVVAEGAPVEVLECNVWCQVSVGGRRGWIFRDYLSRGAD